jgi:hypothetical protein
VAWHHYAAVPGADGNTVVTIDGRLPCVEHEGSLPDLFAALEPQIGRPPYLRVVARATRGDDILNLRAFDATRGAPELLPFADADPEQLAPPELREGLEQWLAEQRGAPVSELRPPWSRPGWHAEAEAWAGTPLEQVRVWPLSAVLHSGATYFKAVFPLFHAEPAITEALAREHPDAVPPVFRAEHDRGWMLMGEVGGTEPNEIPATGWAPVLRTLAEIHVAWSGRTDELLAVGAQDRRIDATLPATLVHGDLNPGNAFVVGERAVIFDWSDACVADPMIDVHTLLFWIQDDAVRAGLVDVYGDARGVARAEMREAFAASEVNAYLHHAESYRAITAALAPEDRWWFEGEEERWLRRASDVRAGRHPSRDT